MFMVIANDKEKALKASTLIFYLCAENENIL
jgi:hypothetical protein